MKKILLAVVCSIIISLFSSTLYAQKKVDSDLQSQIEKHYKELLTKEYEKREQAVFFFRGLKKEQINNDVLNTLSEILNEEKNKGVFKVKKDAPAAGESLGERYGLYIGNLCEIIGSSGDVQRLPLLIEKCMEPKVLLNFGDAAATSMVDIILNPEYKRDKRRSAIFVLGEMLKPKKEGYVAHGNERTKIKEALIRTTSDSEKSIRQVAVRALGESEDIDIIPILEKIVQGDPEHFEKQDRITGGMKTRYPVREEAEKALKKIREKKTESN